MKVKAKISPGKFVCKGEVPAQGKKASPPFCYRLVENENRKTVIELHSNVSGRRIGYIGKISTKPLSRSRAGAGEWASPPGESIYPTLDKKMKHFIKMAQDPDSIPHTTKQYRDITEKAWKAIVKAAKQGR